MNSSLKCIRPHRAKVLPRRLCVVLALGLAATAALSACRPGGEPATNATAPAVFAKWPVAGVNAHGLSVSARPASQKPNVVWILLDACRSENLSCYHYPRKTSPTMDQVAEWGTLFENHFTQGLWTELSVPSFMTGRYFPVRCLEPNGITGPLQPPPGERLLPAVLRECGYFTWCVTAHPIISARSRLARAFHETTYVPPKPGWAKTRFGDLNEAVLSKIAALPQPFFLYLHTMDTHFPHVLEPPHDQWIDTTHRSENVREGQPIKKFETDLPEPDKELLRGLYDGDIHYADACLAQLLHQLSESGLLADTLVMITSDHGELLGEHAGLWGHSTSYDQTMRVPWILSGPGVPQGLRIAVDTENVDIVPTLLDLLGLETNMEADGLSLAPMLRGESAAPARDHVFAYAVDGFDDLPVYTIRTRSEKYIFNSARQFELLWRVPDSIGAREDLLPSHPEIAAKFRDGVLKQYVAKHEQYRSLPKLYVDVPLTRELIEAQPQNQGNVLFLDGDMPSEDLAGGSQWLFMNGCLWLPPRDQEGPTVALQLAAPPRRYTLHLIVLGIHDLWGHPASAVRVKAGNDADYRLVKWMPDPIIDKARDMRCREAGVYEITDGHLNLTLAPGEPGFWSAVCGFRLQFDEAAAASAPEDREQIEEQLRALGYVP